MTKQHYNDLDDEALMALIKDKSDHNAFSTLVERHANRYRSLAYRFTNNVNDAEDIVQDAFVKLWANPDLWQIDKGAKFTTWFYRVVSNQCLDFKRKKKPRAFGEFEDFEDHKDLQDDEYFEKQRLAAVEASIQTLKPDMQMALNLGFYENLPRAEAAEAMGMKLDAFKSLLIRSKGALKHAVEHYINNTQSNNKTTTPRTKSYGT